MAHQFQLLQQQYIQQKEENYHNLCQNMFAPKSKKDNVIILFYLQSYHYG